MNPSALAWRQLMKEKKRVVAAATGILFAVLLMLIQLGFQDSLMASAGVHAEALNADLIVVSPQYQYLLQPGLFPERRLYQATANDQVDSVVPIYIAGLIWKNPLTRNTRMILTIGAPPHRGIFSVAAIDEQMDKLKDSEQVLFDEKGRTEYGPIADMFRRGERVDTELSNRRAVVAGLISIGTTFGVDGTAIVSDQAFLRMLPNDPGSIMLGLVRLKPGAKPEAVRDALAKQLTNDVAIYTRAGFIEHEQQYWSTNTPVGFIFKLGVGMGLVIGTIIVYQILYTDVMEHLEEYATLKAIGYGDTYLATVVLSQGMLLSLMGFIPGALLTTFIYDVISKATFLPLAMTVPRMIFVYGLTAAMCISASAFALRPVRTVDPAEIL